ncbi:unnamed protein product, partial [Mesorhabditis spiculigera]
MRVEPIDSTISQVEEYIKLLIDQWLQEKREIKAIVIVMIGKGWHWAAELKPLLERYERIDVEGMHQPFYRIQRRNGDMMALQTSDYELSMRTSSYYLPSPYSQKFREALRISPN